MKKKMFIILGLAWAMQIVTGCVDCTCAPVKKIVYTNKSFSLRNLDASLPEPRISNAVQIASANYGFRIQLLTEQTAFNIQKVNWSLMQTAQACSCPEDDFIPKEDIMKVEVFSNQDFDINHLKNTDLSLFFKVKRTNGMIPIADYIKSLKDINAGGAYTFFEGIYLQVAPSITNKHKFKMKITLSDGRILEAETPEIELN